MLTLEDVVMLIVMNGFGKLPYCTTIENTAFQGKKAYSGIGLQKGQQR